MTTVRFQETGIDSRVNDREQNVNFAPGSRHWETEYQPWLDAGNTPDVPGPPPVAALPRLVIVNRMTDAEIARTNAFNTSADINEQRWFAMWTAATEIQPDDTATLIAFQTVFGAARVAELLAPES